MAETSDPAEPVPKGANTGGGGRKDREARLAEALRTNLRRRKDAARAGTKPAKPSVSD